MNQLQVGQIIDVYEVVSDFDHNTSHGYEIGTHIGIGGIDNSDYCPLNPVDGDMNCLMLSEAIFAGYYLKVKSLKS